MKKLIIAMLFLVGFVLSGCGGSSGGAPDKISSVPTDLGLDRPDSMK